MVVYLKVKHSLQVNKKLKNRLKFRKRSNLFETYICTLSYSHQVLRLREFLNKLFLEIARV